MLLKTWWKIVHQIAPFEPTFSKKLQHLRGHTPSDTPLRRASATARADSPSVLTSKNQCPPPPPHFENRSATYGFKFRQSPTKSLFREWYLHMTKTCFGVGPLFQNRCSHVYTCMSSGHRGFTSLITISNILFWRCQSHL